MSKTRRKTERSLGLRINVKKEESGQGRLREGLNLLIPVLVFYLGTAWSLLAAFELPGFTWPMVIPGVLLLVLLQSGRNLRRWGYGVTAALFASVLALVLLKKTLVYQGLLLFCNDGAEALGRNTELLLKGYQVTAEVSQQTLAYMIFIGISSIFLAAVCYCVTESRRNGLLFLVLAPVLVMELICGMGAEDWPFLLLLLGAFLVLSGAFLRGTGRKANVTLNKNTALLQTAVWAGILFAAALGVTAFVFSGSEYEKLPMATKLQEAVTEGVNRLRYEKKPVSSFNQGQFDTLGDLELTDKTALKVVMDEPTSLYLRGFVGSVYTSTGWEETKGKELYDERELFYWLHETGFHGLNQLASLYDLENPDKAEEKVQITVQNVNANSKYLYIPYEIETNPDSMEETRSVGDENIRSEKFRGSRVYSYEAAGNLIKEYPQIAAAYYEKQDDSEFQTYTDDESYYNAYVYRQYTSMPAQTEQLLKSHLDTERRSGNNHMSYEEANAFVTSFLTKNLKYSEKINPLGTGDFLNNLLEISAKGYSVHYATAAAMIYRYLGIPARYVEGYLITPDMAAKAGEYEEITVTGEQAHAWVEIYQDGIGWVPMEVTPPYFDLMERPDYEIIADGGAGDQGQEGNAEDGQSQDIEDETPDVPEDKVKTGEHHWGVWILRGIAVLVVLAVLAAVIYEIHQRRKLARYLREIRQADDRRSVCLLGAYMEKWLRYVKLWNGNGSRYVPAKALAENFGEDFADRYRKTVDIVQTGAYSEEEISKEQRSYTEETLQELKEKILKTVGPWKKLRMRLIDFMY